MQIQKGRSLGTLPPGTPVQHRRIKPLAQRLGEQRLLSSGLLPGAPVQNDRSIRGLRSKTNIPPTMMSFWALPPFRGESRGSSSAWSGWWMSSSRAATPSTKCGMRRGSGPAKQDSQSTLVEIRFRSVGVRRIHKRSSVGCLLVLHFECSALAMSARWLSGDVCSPLLCSFFASPGCAPARWLWGQPGRLLKAASSIHRLGPLPLL